MKNSSFIFFLFFIFSSSCNKPEGVPKCIEDNISEYKANGCLKIVPEYRFQGELVYVFESSYELCQIADMTADVYNENCELICSLGGIAGFVDCNGDDFYDNAHFVRNVWAN